MTDPRTGIYGGVDTHADINVAAVVDQTGRILDVESFSTTGAGHRRLLAWMRGRGEVVRVGVEGTGSYGAGLARYLAIAGVEVVEVNRPNRKPGVDAARATPSTLRRRPAPPSMARPAPRPRLATGSSRPSGWCGSRSARPGTPGPASPASSRTSW